MRDVSIVGIGYTPVAEAWDLELRDLATQAAEAALNDAALQGVSSLYVANMLAGQISHQENLGALVASTARLGPIEAARVEAADASGGVALRQGIMAVASGMADVVMVLGVEKYTDLMGNARLNAAATTLDAELEAEQGATPAAMAALLMHRYMHEYGLEIDAFAGFSENAHLNGSLNPAAMYRNKLRPGMFAGAPAIATPVGLFDAAPEGDGAAAVILASTEIARDMVPNPVRIAGSAVATDFVAIQQRENPMVLNAAALSAQAAMAQAGVSHDDIDLFELHDSFAILSVLALESAGFAETGTGYQFGQPDRISLSGDLPITTFGGLKARGHAGGATGIYQAVEATRHIRGTADDNQVPGARIAMIQNLGGIGAVAATHILTTAD